MLGIWNPFLFGMAKSLAGGHVMLVSGSVFLKELTGYCPNARDTTWGLQRFIQRRFWRLFPGIECCGQRLCKAGGPKNSQIRFAPLMSYLQGFFVDMFGDFSAWQISETDQKKYCKGSWSGSFKRRCFKKCLSMAWNSWNWQIIKHTLFLCLKVSMYIII